MRILHVIATMGVGGAETVVRDLSAGFCELGDEVFVASAGGSREQSLVDLGVRTFRIPCVERRPLTALASGWRLRAGIKDIAPDVVLAHNVGATVTARLGMLAARCRVPLVATFHGVSERDYRSSARILRSCRATVVVVAEAIADPLVAASLPRSSIRCIRNEVAAPVRHPRDEARARLGLPREAPVALCAARLVPQKRHDILLQAWREVDPAAVLLIAGDGELRSDIEKVAADPFFSGRVRLLGIRDDVDRLMSAADVFVLASDWEGMPLAVLEALALDLPVVATDVHGLREACSDRAILVPPRDPVMLAKALTTAFNMPRRLHGQSSELTRQGTTGPDKMAKAYRVLFSELIAAAGA